MKLRFKFDGQFSHPLYELGIHFNYLIFFVIINIYFFGPDFFIDYAKNNINRQVARNFLTASLTTFSLIGFVFCISIVFTKKPVLSDYKFIQTVFKFGIDYLYFIMLTSALIFGVVYLMSFNEKMIRQDFLLSALIALTASYVLRVIHCQFEKNLSIHINNDKLNVI